MVDLDPVAADGVADEEPGPRPVPAQSQSVPSLPSDEVALTLAAVVRQVLNADQRRLGAADVAPHCSRA